MMRCYRCRKTKPDDEFYLGKKRQIWCKECKSQYAQERYDQEKQMGPYALCSTDGFLQTCYSDKLILAKTIKMARPYVTYHNACLVKTRLEKMGYTFKIIPLRT